MNYIKITFSAVDVVMSDILIALLSGIEYEGFEEGSDTLTAFIDEEKFDKTELDHIARQQSLSYIKDVILPTNWNAEWEGNFQPVIVKDFCTIRADFHTMKVETPYEVIITPKMSFGTGHHATTQLMMTQMRGMNLKGKKVFDFGTGTGILAILASMLGAGSILGIDNDEWSYENALENISRNPCHDITIERGSLEDVDIDNYDVILANINRHILLQYMNDLYIRLNADGMILMSGLLVTDREIILQAAEKAGFKLQKIEELDNWMSVLFAK